MLARNRSKKSKTLFDGVAIAQTGSLRKQVRDLRIEVDRLNKLNVELSAENQVGHERPAGYGDNVFVFSEDDETKEAFDEFFSQEDPYLDEVRDFLLKD